MTGFAEHQVPGVDESWCSILTFAKTFTAGVVGEATTLFLSAGVEGARTWVATERIIGRTEGGGGGTVTIQHGGSESDPDAAYGHIVPGTGTGDFAGWAGSARIRHDADGAFFEIELAGTAGPDA